MKKVWVNCTVAPDAEVHEGVILHEGVHVGKGAIIYPSVEIGSGSFIGPYCTIGEPVASFYTEDGKHAFKSTKIGQRAIIRSHSIIYEDVDIGQNFQCGHRVAIREGTRIGTFCSAGTVSDIQGQCTIGNYVRMHSNVHIGQMSVIEDYVWIYPYVVLTNDPYPPMNLMKGVTIREFAQVATGAILMPGITIGRDAIVGAGAVVRVDVPSERVVVGVPAKDICSVRTLRDESGHALYPWREHLKEDRGYPWQRPEQELKDSL
jgi:acetyltransferase-like isoleucine patch superfamily enzyme